MLKTGRQTNIATTILNRYHQGDFSEERDLLTVEEPLEIRIGFGPEKTRDQKRLSVTMRTPGNDEELATGFLLSEGIISTADDISVRYCHDVKKPEENGNVIRVELSPSVELDWKKLERNFYSNSSCGVCGKSSIESLEQKCVFNLQEANWEISSSLLISLPEILSSKQPSFSYTGGIHAAALFSRKGELIMLREDVGRHNALDKLIGAALIKGLIPLEDYLILVSGRIGFELVQKAMMAGVPFMAAIGAPSSLAVQMAEESDMTMVGFLKKNRFNIYSGKNRINLNLSH